MNSKKILLIKLSNISRSCDTLSMGPEVTLGPKSMKIIILFIYKETRGHLNPIMIMENSLEASTVGKVGVNSNRISIRNQCSRNFCNTFCRKTLHHLLTFFEDRDSLPTEGMPGAILSRTSVKRQENAFGPQSMNECFAHLQGYQGSPYVIFGS